jgi:hypothetical protein
MTYLECFKLRYSYEKWVVTVLLQYLPRLSLAYGIPTSLPPTITTHPAKIVLPKIEWRP